MIALLLLALVAVIWGPVALFFLQKAIATLDRKIMRKELALRAIAVVLVLVAYWGWRNVPLSQHSLLLSSIAIGVIGNLIFIVGFVRAERRKRKTIGP